MHDSFPKKKAKYVMKSHMEMLVSVLSQIKAKKTIWVLRWFYHAGCRWSILRSQCLNLRKCTDTLDYSCHFVPLCKEFALPASFSKQNLMLRKAS